MKYDIALNPIHYACVSGGKDSLYMLNYILHHLDKYPLDLVVHYELEIDWEWAVKVVDYMEEECKKHNIRFWRVKPRKSWKELEEKYYMPSRVVRWCNSKYKMDAENQVREWVKSLNCRPIAYIGLCADEEKRFKYEIGGGWESLDICYPLAEEGIKETTILEWAKNVPIFNGWYKIFRRQGCMYCPMLSKLEITYMYKHYKEKYEDYIKYIKRWENKFNTDFFARPLDKVERDIKGKYLERLNFLEENEQTNIWEFIQ